MFDPAEFKLLMQRVRAGDQQAAAEIVQRYEPLIRREVRLRLEDQRLRRVFDSLDVCQSVLASFFVRCAVGEYELDEPAHLLRLLVTMTRNKVSSSARKQHQQKRDQRRQAVGDDATAFAASSDPSPSEIVSGNELLARARAALSDDERRLAELRSAGHSWDQVAAELGGTAGARRVQFTRAMQRVTAELGLEDDPDE